MFPELEGIGDYLDCDEVIIDSEGIGIDPETKKLMLFQDTIKRKRKQKVEVAQTSIPLTFLFLILQLDGKSLIKSSAR